MEAPVVNENISTLVGDDGILVATIDMPGRSMNVFSDELMDALEGLLDDLRSRPRVRGVVIASGKKTFLVGADLSMVRRYTENARHDSVEALQTTCGRLGRLFRRLETCGVPVVAAVGGLALGGGLELALACHRRVASDEPATQLGVPEIKLGLLPGAGGTQRLPRLVGTKTAFEMLLGGEPVSARRALELGLVDEIVPGAQLLNVPTQRALELSGNAPAAPWDRDGWRFPLNAYNFDSPTIVADIANGLGIDQERLGHYPAYTAIINSVIGGWTVSMDDACRWEMRCFIQLIQDPVAGNLVRTLFLNRQRAMKSLGRGVRDQARQVHIKGPVSDALALILQQAGVQISALKPEAGVNTPTLSTDPSEAGSTCSDIAWLRATAPFESFPAESGIWVSDASEYGRVAEICRKPSSANEDTAALDIVRWLNAIPLFTRQASLLQSLESIQAAVSPLTTEERLLAMAFGAARLWCLGGIGDVDVADVASVLAGFFPAYTGGPFTYLRQRTVVDVRASASRAAARYGALFDMPLGCDALWTATPQQSA